MEKSRPILELCYCSSFLPLSLIQGYWIELLGKHSTFEIQLLVEKDWCLNAQEKCSRKCHRVRDTTLTISTRWKGKGIEA